MNKAGKRLLFTLLLTSALLPLKAASQSQTTAAQSQTFTLKTTTEVVLVNVTVRDKNGTFVKDLKAGDFTILEDGKKQTILSIDTENTDGVVSGESPREPILRLAPASSTAQPKSDTAVPLQENDLKDRRLIVLFFDLGSMQPQEIEHLRQRVPTVAHMAQYFKEMGFTNP